MVTVKHTEFMYSTYCHDPTLVSLLWLLKVIRNLRHHRRHDSDAFLMEDFNGELNWLGLEVMNAPVKLTICFSLQCFL
jgi:hypothetical protein